MAIKYNGQIVRKLRYNGKYIKKIYCNSAEETFYNYNETALESFTNKPTITNSISNVNAVINLHNGNLKVFIPDAVFGKSTFGISVGHIYNSMMDDDAIHAAKWTFMGKGFKINYQQYLLYSEKNSSYYYIDDSGAKHEFTKTMNGNTYYDTSGTGKILNFGANTLTLTDRESNELVFDKTSGFIKKIKNNHGHITEIYYSNAKISSIMKSVGNETRTMSFDYDEFDRLVTINYDGTRNQIEYLYKQNTSLLEFIKKRTPNQEELVVKLEYNDKKQLTQIKNIANQAIKFYYDGEKLFKIQEGIIKGNTFRLLKNQTITYQNGKTEVTTMVQENLNDKIDAVNQIRMVYQYNYKGDMLSTYERYGNNYASVFPASNIGTRLMRKIDDNSFPSFNGVAINNFSKDEKDEEQNVHQKSNGKSGDKSNNIGAVVNLINETCEFARTFTFSFWYQMPYCFTSTKTIKLKIYFTKDSYIEKEIKSIDENWHYISFEKYFKTNEEIEKIEMFLVAEKNKDFSAQITDIRAIQNITNTKIKDGNSEVDIRKISEIRYDNSKFIMKDIRDVTSENDYFITARDILWNEYEKQRNSGLFYLNNGAKLMEVDYKNKNLQFLANASIYVLRTSNYTTPFLFNEMINDKNTSIKSHSYHSEVKEEYEEITRGYKGNIQTRIFKRYDRCMRLIEEIDEYDLQTKYEYDIFGNIKKTIVNPLDCNDSIYTIHQENQYDHSGNIKQNVHTKDASTDYNIGGVYGNVKSVVDANKRLKKEFTQDATMEKISSIKYLIGTRFATEYKSGVVSYNDKGRFESFVRSDKQSYGCYYNENDDEGNITEYKINNQRIKSKMTRYHSRGVLRRAKHENETKWHDTFYDIYGRIDVKREDGIDKYINVFEDKAGFRSSGALLRRATDNYAETTHSFDYDANESLHRYSYAGRGISGSVEVSESSIPSEMVYSYKQNYDFKINDRAYKGDYSSDIKIQYDSKKIINPRISEEKSTASGIKCNYTYDKLGRINKLVFESGKASYNEKNEYLYSYREIDTKLGRTTTYDIETIVTKYAFIVYDTTGAAIPPAVSYNECYYAFEYDNNHNIRQCIMEDFNMTGRTIYHYDYDELNRLICEEIRVGVGAEVKEYDYDEFGNRKKTVVKLIVDDDEENPASMSFSETKEYQYDASFKDRLKSIYNLADSSKNCYFEYDSIGNPIKYKVSSLFKSNNMVWTRGNLLSTYSDDIGNTATYKYSVNGTRVEKKCQYQEKTMTSKFHLDGSKILGETKIISDNLGDSIVALQYEYNHTGVIGIVINGNVYLYEKDALGNVIKIHYLSQHGQELVASYEYDAWGNFKEIINIEHENLLKHNSCLWKGHYYDRETGFYYINGNYYDPETGRYINSNDLEDMVLNSSKVMESTYCLENCNPIMFSCNIDTNEPCLKLNMEFNYKKKSIWLLIQKIIEPLITLVTMILIVLFPPAGILGFIISALLLTASAILLEFEVAELREHFTNINVIRQGHNMSKSTYDRIRTGLVITVIVLSITSAFLPRTQCFKKGVLVKTKEKNKKIEDIAVGDKVWAWDEKTKTKSLKKVVNIFRNEPILKDGTWVGGTNSWIHITVDSSKDEIICTPGHKFYLPNNNIIREVNEVHEHAGYESLSEKWISTKNLKIGDKVLLANDEYGIISNVVIEKLETPECTYNFEVEDFHTYYVGEHGVLCHNTCAEVQKVFKEFGVDSFDEMATKFTPDEMIGKLDNMGYSKSVGFQSTKSGPATFMKSANGKLEFRIMPSPSNGASYFRVMNGYGNYLNAAGKVLDFNNPLLTHFYFGGG